MANMSLFGRPPQSRLPAADTVNQAGGRAYALSDFHALCQLAFTGAYTSTFYDASDGAQQLTQLKERAEKCTDEQIAKLAIAARTVGYMKQMPASLVTILSRRNPVLLHKVFKRVATGDRVFKDIFTMALSGAFGRKSLGTALRNEFRRKLYNSTPEWLMTLRIGTQPSLKDIFKMTHPRPRNPNEAALFGFVLDNTPDRWFKNDTFKPTHPYTLLPNVLQAYYAYNHTDNPAEQLRLLPYMGKLRWELLGSNAKSVEVWKAIAHMMPTMALRMNLNTLLRHKVFEDARLVDEVAARLSDKEEIRKGKQFPYQYLTAYSYLDQTMPQAIKTAMHAAADAACGNIPMFPGPVIIGVDLSGSMNTPVTGLRENASKSTCADVAALAGVAMWRKNPDSVLVPFHNTWLQHNLDPNDSLLSLTRQVSALGTGGTDCAAPIEYANRQLTKRPFAGAVILSDNESWICNTPMVAGTERVRKSTRVVAEWETFKRNQQRLGVYPDPTLVTVDLAPNINVQVPERSDMTAIGGFSDAVFALTDMAFRHDPMRFVNMVEAIDLDYDPQK